MKKPICKLNFRQFSPTNLDTFGQKVLNGIYNYPVPFTAPAIAKADYEDAYNAYVSTYLDYEKYGITKKSAYLNAKASFLEVLNTLALYVELVALGDISIIALSGYEPSREVNEPVKPLEKIDNFSAKRTENAGEVQVMINAITGYGRITYTCFCVEGQPIEGLSVVNGQLRFPAEAPVVFYDNNKTRKKIFNNLTVGRNYFFYVFATNAISVSPLSDYRQVMAA